MPKRGENQTEALFELEIDKPPVLSRPQTSFHLEWPQYDCHRPRPDAPAYCTIGLLQYAPQVRTPADNIEFISQQLASVHDATIVLPEFFLGSYTKFDSSIVDRSTWANHLRPLQELSKDQCLALVGSLPVAKADRVTNNVVIISRGIIQFSLQDKGKLFGREISAFAPGEHSRQVNLNGLQVSIQVCMDIVDPLPCRQSVTEGARAILGPSTVSVDYLRTIHKARALENQVVNVFCNRTGKDLDGTQYLGRSAIFFPDGAELAAPRSDDQLLTATIDLEYVRGFIRQFGYSNY